MQKIPILIAHPRSSEYYPATVAPQCPARTILAGLQAEEATPEGPFLDPAQPGSEYVMTLKRTGAAIPPDTTMAGAGVQANDVLELQRLGMAAR